MKLAILNRFLPILAIIPLIALVTTGCSSPSSSHADLAMASMDGMPENIKSAPSAVQGAYQFAAANPSLMGQIPCYCGCGDIGHTSNYDCYVSGEDANGNLVYDDHALGCSICVDITQDVMRLSRLAKPVDAIRAYIDQTYSQYGPANLP